MDALWGDAADRRRGDDQPDECDVVDCQVGADGVRQVACATASMTRMPAAGKSRRRLTTRSGVAQLGFGGCGGMYNYFLGVASVLQVGDKPLSVGGDLAADYRR